MSMWDSLCGNIMTSDIKIRKVDSKGRVIIPLKNEEQVFMAEKEGVILISPSESSLELALQSLEKKTKEEQTKMINDWFQLITAAGLEDMCSNKIHESIGKSLVRKKNKIEE